MPSPIKPLKGAHKLGANSHDSAKKPHPRDKNFRQSRDIREDRGTRQMKNFSGRR